MLDLKNSRQVQNLIFHYGPLSAVKNTELCNFLNACLADFSKQNKKRVKLLLMLNIEEPKVDIFYERLLDVVTFARQKKFKTVLELNTALSERNKKLIGKIAKIKK
ncbi:MAG: hypothetical protein AAB438_02220 [Patescibacteria group bacterium]